MIVKCDSCGKEFNKIPARIKRSKHNFCSVKCANEFKKTQTGFKSPRYKGILDKRKCLICGEIYKPTQRTQKYCSFKCAGKSRANKVTFICKQCNKEFQVPASHAYWSEKRGNKNHFCSTDCLNKHRATHHSANWINDRRLIKNVKFEARFNKKMKEWRKKVYERDNYTCQMCGNRSAKNNPVQLNVHHILMFSKYKELRDDVDNGITLCEPCHKSIYRKEEEYENLFKRKVAENKCIVTNV